MSEKVSGNAFDIKIFLRLMSYAKGYKLRFFIAAISTITLALVSAVNPYIVGITVNDFVNNQDIKQLTFYIQILSAIVFAEVILQFLFIYYANWVGQHIIRDIRAKVFRNIQSFKMSYFDTTSVGRLVTRVVSDIETIADIFSQGLLVIIAELLKLVIVIAVMFYTDWRLSLIALLTVPILLVATAWFKRNIKASFQAVRDKVSAINSFVQEHIVGMNIVQIFNREEAEFKKFKKINEDHRDAHVRSIFYYAVFFPVVEVLSAVSIGLIVWYGGEAILSGKDMTLGKIIAFILYIQMMFRPIRQLADRFNILQMGIVGSERVFRILDTKDKILNDGEIEVSDLNGAIKFDKVWFKYKANQWILNDLTFNIEAGKFLALVGHTGAGKSSIIRILNRFYEIDKGKIKIDNISIEDFKLKSLRDNIALVQQEVFLFSDSILNNITLYEDSISRDEVVNASKEIGIYEFIISLPGGLDYVVGERGVTLSSGQRQLIAFLRVYMRNPKILILDEATASIDSATEELLQNALSKLSKNRTTIVIAHRLSTIVKADKILLLDAGKILEQGDHKSLIELNGEYSKMYSNQIKDLD